MGKTEVIDAIIAVEGEYVNDPSDSGGETNFGVTLPVARANGYRGPMREMPREVAFSIYAKKYWDAVSADQLQSMSPLVAEEVVDSAVNMGVRRAVKMLQRSLNVLNNGRALYHDLKVDGIVGVGTLTALAGYLARRGDLELVKALNCLQGAFYIGLAERREKDERFIYGWLKNRVKV